MGLRFGGHLAEKSENNLWLVCCVAGNKSKLRKHPKICVLIFQLKEIISYYSMERDKTLYAIPIDGLESYRITKTGKIWSNKVNRFLKTQKLKYTKVMK